MQVGFGPAAALTPPLLAEHEGSILPGMALGGTTAAMLMASLAAWAGSAGRVAGLVPVRCIPAHEGREGSPQEVTSCVPTVLVKRSWRKSAWVFFPHFKLRTSLSLLPNYISDLI